ncbi:MAG: hypothetical protein ACF8Q5_06580 [Phycisphaerales bacterium JB040]
MAVRRTTRRVLRRALWSLAIGLVLTPLVAWVIALSVPTQKVPGAEVFLDWMYLDGARQEIVGDNDYGAQRAPFRSPNTWQALPDAYAASRWRVAYDDDGGTLLATLWARPRWGSHVALRSVDPHTPPLLEYGVTADGQRVVDRFAMPEDTTPTPETRIDVTRIAPKVNKSWMFAGDGQPSDAAPGWLPAPTRDLPAPGEPIDPSTWPDYVSYHAAFGWPWPAMRLSARQPWAQQPGESLESFSFRLAHVPLDHAAFTLSEPDFGHTFFLPITNNVRPPIPLGPAPLGCALNTLTYAAMILIPWELAGWHVRRRRRRNNRCPFCAHSLAGLPAHAPCPECGTAPKSGVETPQASPRSETDPNEPSAQAVGPGVPRSDVDA